MAMLRSLLLLTGLVLLSDHCRAGFYGREFITAFMENNIRKTSTELNFQLFITSYQNTTVRVKMNISPYQKIYSLTEGETLSVDVPESTEMRGSSKSDRSILIEAENDISVVLMYKKSRSLGAMTVYPAQELGTVYYVVTPSGTKSTRNLKEFAIIGWRAPTTVDIHLKADVTSNGQLHRAGSILHVSLEALQVIQIQSVDDLSGTMIQSANRVAVLSGHSCFSKNSYCDHVVEQLLPVPSWGTSFIVPPVFFQTKSDIAYVIAAQNTHIEYRKGILKRSLDMIAGEVRQFDISFPQALYISANAGIQVLFLFTGINSTQNVVDPFLINIPAITSYGQSYHIDRIGKLKNSAVLIAKRSETGSITRDKQVIRGIQWNPIPGTLYSWGTYNLEAEVLSLSLEHPESPFGVLVFGGEHAESYGFAPPPVSSSGCKAKPLDLVMVIDGSKSIGTKNFELVKTFVNNIVDFLDVSLHGTRVGLVQYSRSARTEFPLNQYTTAAEIKAAVQRVQYKQGGTKTGLALKHMMEQSFSPGEGARPLSKDIRRIGLVFTDGKSEDNVTEWATLAKISGIVMYAVGIGKAEEEELKSIVSEPVDEHFLYGQNYSTIQQIASKLRVKICDSFSCPPNSHYELSGKGCPATCQDALAQETCDILGVEGCFCDSGFVLSGDQCVPLAECGCVHEGRYYKKGQEFYSDNSCWGRCYCVDHGIGCVPSYCEASGECRVENGIPNCLRVGYGTYITSGDPHYITFDGRSFYFYGSCAYTLAKVCGKDPQLEQFSVVVENEKPSGSSAVLIRTVVVSIHGYTVILERGMKWKAMVDGELHTLPMSRDAEKLWITKEGNNIIIHSSLGFMILYDTFSYIRVSVPTTYQGHMCGLLGNFNGNKSDDFMLPNGKIAQNEVELGASWKVTVDGVSCSDVCGEKCPNCYVAKAVPYKSEHSCGSILSQMGPFGACHRLKDPTPYFEHCVHDMCVAKGTQESLCRSLRAYVAACQAVGAEIDAWRSDSFCPLSCPANSHYETCTTTCNSTCASLSTPTWCTRKCFEGCQCNEGYVFDGDTCVPLNRCGCVHNGLYFKAGESLFSRNCTEKCTCAASSQITCEETSCREEESCTLKDGVHQCVTWKGQCTLSPGAQLTTFDGASALYSFDGACVQHTSARVYDVVSVCDESAVSWFRVSVSIEASEAGLTIGKAVYIHFQEASITVKKNRGTWVNGRLVRLPYKISEALSMRNDQDGILIVQASQMQVHLYADGGVMVRVKENLAGKLCAPCGNFNGDTTDDFRTPSGEVKKNIAEALCSWKAPDI